MKDALEGAFMTPEERAKIPPSAHAGGGANATTAYLYTYLSRKFGPVYVFRGKLPTFPNTWANAKTMPDGQVQYWSVATMAAATSGSLWDARVRQLITQLIEYAEVSLKTFPYNSVSGGPAMGFLTFKALSTSACS